LSLASEAAYIRIGRDGNANVYTGYILFQNGTRNGFKIAGEYAASAARQRLVFYSSNNSTSPYEPIWDATMTITHTGAVGIGTASPGYKLQVASGSTGEALGLLTTTSYACVIYKCSSSYRWAVGNNSSDQFYFYNGRAAGTVAYFTYNGSLVTTGDQTVSSDINLKENLAPVTYGVEDIAKTRAVTFDWKDGRGHSAGSIAQDWKPLIPELVHGEEGNMTLAYGQIALLNTVLLARHETEQDKEIRELKDKLFNAENRIKELENRLKIS
jgi:hypothetical protein